MTNFVCSVLIVASDQVKQSVALGGAVVDGHVLVGAVEVDNLMVDQLLW